MLYRITDGTLAIGGENLLEHFDFEIKGRERIAITGLERFRKNNVFAADCRGAVSGKR